MKPSNALPANDPSQGDEVGYGRPPKHSRFRPGESGNQRGRPPGRKNFTTVIREYAQGRMKVTEGGRDKTLPRFDALQRTMWAQAFKGNPKALAFVLQSLREAGLLKAEPQEEMEQITPEDQTILRDYLSLHGVTLPDPQPSKPQAGRKSSSRPKHRKVQR